MKRIALKVIEECDEDGRITPLAVVYGDKRYEIERILSVTRHAPDAPCVSPLRYDCIISGKKKTIYRDSHPSDKWFSVKKLPVS